MQRKFAFLLNVFVLCSLIAALMGQGTVSAQDEQPPAPPSPQPAQLRWPTYDREFKAGEGEKGQADAEKVFTLGQPGLSYRYVQTFGVAEEAYPADTAHLNRPVGLFMDNSNNLYVAEESGARVLKYNASGTNLLALGTAGLCFTDDYVFCSPKDMGLDGSGNLWVADGNRVVAYNASGTFLRQLPSVNPWEPGTDTTHFDFVNGVVFDGLGRMYVSDTNNHRVQVYTFSAGAPVYHSTIGVTAQEGSDNAHFSYPYRLAIDSINRVYVVDGGNNRIQRCTRGATWACATFASGFNLPHGITIDNANNVYIADTGRIRKCLSNGTCSDFVTNTYDFYDLEADSGGNVYGAGTYDGIVVKYNSSGAWQGIFLGEELVPYQTDDSHYYSPRIAIDSQDNIIIVEETGQRLLKLNSAGNLLWSVGVPGVDAPDNDHLNYPHGVAVDTAGKIYVADNNRVQIFSAAGAYLNTIGGNWGSGDYEFEWASGIAVDNSGVIYVADCPNNRVQVYNSALTYVATIGQTGVPGSDNAHLTCPIGVGVDSARNVYVADAGNNRVQKFNSSRVWQMTLGTPGPWGSGSNAHSHFGSGPEDIAVDAQGRIFVADIWNNRVQVFNSAGGYLTTIAGSWGTKTGELRNASGVDVDSQGNVYVSDLTNHRIQKFSPGVPGWQQVNINGFGNVSFPSALSMAAFNNQLYAGASNWDGSGASIWRTANGTSWSRVVTSGFGQGGTNPAVIGMMAFKGNLYAGTGWGGAPGQLWRSPDGTSWTQITGNGIGTSSGPISTFAVYGNTLYAGTCGDGGAAGAQIWRSATGNSGTWVSVVTSGLTTTDNACVTSLKEFSGSLYASVENPVTGAQIWRSATGSIGTWTQVNTSGFGTSSDLVGGFAVYAGYLYIGSRGGTANAQLWRSNNGTTWNAVTTDGFGDPHNWKVESLYAFNGALYAGINNDLTGLEVWRFDGTAWNQVNADGFGDSNNQTTLWSNETLVFNNNLYMGVFNGAKGVEIWRTVPVTISGNVGVTGASLSYNEGIVKTTTSLANGSYSLPVSYYWSGTVTPSHACFTFSPPSRNYNNISGNQPGQNYSPTLIPGSGCADVNVRIGGTSRGRFGLLPGESTRASFAGLDSGPVKLESTNAVPLIGAERLIYKFNNLPTSFTEMMGLPNSQLDTIYWLPWYNNLGLDTQLRIANVSNATASVHVYIGGDEMDGSPFTLLAGASLKKSFPGIDDGPVKIESNQNIVAAARLIYKVSGANTSFSEIMALPASQLDKTYWLPWYNNTGLDTQLRFANVTDQVASVHIYIGGEEMIGSPFTLQPGESTRKNFPGIDAGPVKIESTQNIVAAERLIYKANGLPTSFTEMMALPDKSLDSTYWLPWYNNLGLDTQLRFANVSASPASVHVYIGGEEMDGSPFTLPVDGSMRISFPAIDDGPVQIVSNQNVVVAERLIYKVDNLPASFSEMMALPDSQLDSTYWLPWYNNLGLDTQLRFGVP